MCALSLCTITGISAQEILWQKDIKSSARGFLSQITTTIDGHYLITGSSIQTDKLRQNSKQNNGYDFHLIKLNQQGEQVLKSIFLETITTIYLQRLLLRTVVF